MNNILIEKLDRPEELEALYQSCPSTFKSLLCEALSLHGESETLRVWDARLSYKKPAGQLESKVSLLRVIFLSLTAGIIAKLPVFWGLAEDWYYPRFIPFAVIIPVIIYFLNKIPSGKTVKFVVVGLILSIFYMLILPEDIYSASITMALIHMPLVLLTLLATAFMAHEWEGVEARLNYIRYIGEIVIYTSLILLGGVILTLLTFGLFNLIGLSIENWYMEYVVVLGLVSSPLVATYLYDSVLGRSSKFATVLSNVFSPLFLITVLAYLIASVYQAKSPFSDREFLIIFNGLLLVIWAVTVFSISGKSSTEKTYLADVINITLIIVTLVVNAVALSAITMRWAEYGITPNRVVVAGANILIFIHLILLLWQYIKYVRMQGDIKSLETTVAKYLPVYSIWSLIVVVLMPVLFQFL